MQPDKAGMFPIRCHSAADYAFWAEDGNTGNSGLKVSGFSGWTVRPVVDYNHSSVGLVTTTPRFQFHGIVSDNHQPMSD